MEFFNALVGQDFTVLTTTGGGIIMDTQVTLKYIGYARKSSEDNKERQAASLPDQLFILEGLKSKQGLTIIDILQESKSAHIPRQREKFSEMLSLIDTGKANAIATWHANRLARNMSDGGDVINLMDMGKLIEIRTPSRIYRNTPEDKWMLSVEFANSKKDSDDKSIVVSRGLEKKCREGWRPGWAPLGYLNDKGTESGLRRIYLDPERFPFVKKVFELFLSGTPVTEILRLSQEEWHLTTPQKKRIGGRPLCLSEVYMILNNPFYSGKFEYPVGSGNWFESNPTLERAISPEVFEQVQIKLGKVSQYKTKHNYTYAHTMKCGFCASGVVTDGKWQVVCTNCRTKFQLTKKVQDHCPHCDTFIKDMTNPTMRYYVYNRCGRKKSKLCKELSISDKELERQTDQRLAEIELSPLFLEWAIDQLRLMQEEEKQFRETTIDATKKAYDDSRKRLDNLVALKISPANTDGSLLSDEEFKIRKLELEAGIKVVEKQIGNIDERMIQANDETVKVISFAAQARKTFAITTDPKVKRDIFIGLSGLHLTLQDKTVDFDSPFYFEKIVEMKKQVPIIGKRIVPNEETVDVTKTAEFVSAVPTLLRGPESHWDRQIMHLLTLL